MSIAQGEQEALASPAGSQPTLPHVLALDGLRGLAVAAVLLFHAGHLTGGWLGVDLFFVLSGFLITSLLLAEHRSTGGIGLVAFWGRRARRLLPALVVVLLAVAGYAALELGPADKAVARGDGLASLFFVANWHDILQGASYWDRGLSPSLLAHTWSLAVEEQMYLGWPVLVLLVLRGCTSGRARRILVLATVVALGSAALALGLYAAGASVERIYLGTDTRVVAVALGAMVAAWRARPGGVSPDLALRIEGAGIGAGVALLALWCWLDGTSPVTYRGGLVLASVLAAVVVAAAADPRSRMLGVVLELRALRALGLVSYGAYLWHLPVYVVLSEARVGRGGAVLLVVRVAVTLVLATATYRLVERPIRERRPAGWWVGWRGLASAVVAVAVVAVALVVGTSGARSARTDAAGLDDGVARSAAVDADLPTVAVVGDSVAASIARPAIEDPLAFGQRTVRSTVNGCQVVADGKHRIRGLEGDVTTPGPCPSDIARLVAEEAPAAVLVDYGGWVDAEVEIDGRWRSACDPEYVALFEQRLAEVVDEAASGSPTVVVATAARSTNTFRPDDSDEHIDCANAAAKRVVERSPSAELLDVDAWLCPDGTCRETIDGLLVRSDGVHFNGPGGAKASAWVFDEVARLGGLARPIASATTTGPSTDDALVTVCESYAVISDLSDATKGNALSKPDAATRMEGALDGFAAPILAELPDDVAADLEGLGAPQVRTDLLAVIAGVQAGEVNAASHLSPSTKAALDRGLARLRQAC